MPPRSSPTVIVLQPEIARQVRAALGVLSKAVSPNHRQTRRSTRKRRTPQADAAPTPRRKRRTAAPSTPRGRRRAGAPSADPFAEASSSQPA